MTEWKLFDQQVPEPAASLPARPWMSLEGQPGFTQRAGLVAGLARWAAPVRSVTDLGCGDGSLLARLRDVLLPADIPMWGYDLGKADLAYGQQRGLDLRSGDITKPHRLEYGELVIATEVAEHLEDPEDFLRGIQAALLIVSSPSAETGDWHNPIHAWAWDRAGYDELVRRSGWTPVWHAGCDAGLNTFAGVTALQRFQAILAVR